jgi:pilus assembly protein Flp/PilA
MTMKKLGAGLLIAIRHLAREHGQDLVEYALVIALLAFGCTAAMKSLAAGVGVAFNNVGTALSTSIT